jgi:hypothetical protein
MPMLALTEIEQIWVAALVIAAIVTAVIMFTKSIF